MPDSDEAGMALLVAVFALAIVSILGFFMTMNATTGVQISDNFESQLQATYAAMAGLNHAGALLRGLPLDEVLKGPDGTYNSSLVYINQAKSFQFRLPVPLLSAQILNLLDPTSDVSGIPDDGIISTGFFEGGSGMELIPKVGIGQLSPNPYGSGQVVNSRYFVKVTDNNGEASELAADPGNNPFADGDGIVIVRSLGVSKTFSDQTGSVVRRNSVAVFELRLKRLSTWDIGPALMVLGSSVDAFFDGSPEISGNHAAGIGTLDTDPGDAHLPESILREAVGTHGTIEGGGLPNPSVLDISAQIGSGSDQELLLNAGYLWEFITNRAPRMADHVYAGSQDWLGGSTPFLGFYDSARPWNAPEQNPQITLVKGDLHAPEGFSGGGVLIITGSLVCSGPISFYGLILVMGSGSMEITGSGQGIVGGVFVANLATSGTDVVFGIPGISIGGTTRIVADRNAVKMAIGLIQATQISFREIAGSDP